jgi:hypothetical protein
VVLQAYQHYLLNGMVTDAAYGSGGFLITMIDWRGWGYQQYAHAKYQYR